MKYKTDVTIHSRKYDGSINKSWTVNLLKYHNPLLLFIGIFENEFEHQDLGLIRRGTISYEYYWLGKWFNVFRLHEADGIFRNFYCNINMPPKFENDVLDYIDLDIDILVDKDLTYKILDRTEFEQNSKLYQYPKEIILQTESVLEELQQMISQKNFPFSEICKMPFTD